MLQDDPDDLMRTAIRQVLGVFAELDRKTVVKGFGDGRPGKAAEGKHAVGVSAEISGGRPLDTRSLKPSTPNHPYTHTARFLYTVGFSRSGWSRLQA